MNLRQTRFVLKAISLMMLIGGLALTVFAFRPPARTSIPDTSFVARKPNSTESELIRSPDIEQFQQVWNKRLRRPLYDPPPPPPAPPKEKPKPRRNRNSRPRKSAPKLDVKLVGTVMESNHTMAFLMNGDGRVDLKRIGDTLDVPPGARVEQIERDQVTVSVGDQSLTLKMPEPETP